MTALSAQQKADLRTEPYALQSYIYLSQPTTVFAARVNGAGTYPLTSITFDTVTTGAYTDLKDGMTLTIGTSAGAWDLGIQRVKSATSTTISVGRSSIGTNIGELTVSDNAYITVYKDYRIWSKIPYIGTDGTQYKDGTITFTAADAQPPVANCGPDRLFIVASASATQSVDFSGTGSFAVASGVTISTYLWDVDGGTITVGTSASSAITVEFTNTGERYVSLTVTDSASKTHTARCLVVLAEEGDCLDAVVGRETITPAGISWEFGVFGADLPAGFMPGSQVLYAQTEYWGSSSGQIVGNETRFSGWMSQNNAAIRATEDGNLERTITVQCVDVAGRLKELVGFPLSLDRATTPASWYEMANADPDRMVHHILYWHSTAIDRADFSRSGTGSSYPFPGFATLQGSLWSQAEYVCNAIAFTLTCNTSGQLKMKGDPIIQPTAAQASELSLPVSRTTTVRDTLTQDDYEALSFDDRVFPRNHWLDVEAIIASTGLNLSTVFCLAPGLVPGQGVASPSLTKQIGFNTDEVLVRAGHHYAARVNPARGNLRITPLWGGWVWEPADMEWLQITLSSTYQAQNGVTFSDQKTLITQIDNTYDFDNGSKRSEMSLELELTGALATDYDKLQPQQLSDLVFDPITFPAMDVNFGNWIIPAYTEEIVSGNIVIPSGTEIMGAIVDKNAGIAYHIHTTTFGSGSSTVWTATDLSATITDKPLDAIVDPNSTDDMIVVSEGSIWRVTNANTASPGTPTQLLDFTVAGFTSSAGRHIEWSLANPLFLAVISSYTSTETGTTGAVHVDWSTDGGSTWNNIDITATLVVGYSTESSPLGLMLSHVNPGEAWFWYWNGVGAKGMPAKLGYTDDYFATVDFDAFFGTLQTASYLSNVPAGSRQSVYPYTYQKSGLAKIWFEDAIKNFGGSSTIWLRDQDAGAITYKPTYTGDSNGDTIDRSLRTLAISWTNPGYGAKIAGSQLFTSKDLPGSWQNKLDLGTTVNFPSVILATDNKTITVYGDRNIMRSSDFGVTIQSQWGNASTAMTPVTTARVRGVIGG